MTKTLLRLALNYILVKCEPTNSLVISSMVCFSNPKKPVGMLTHFIGEICKSSVKTGNYSK